MPTKTVPEPPARDPSVLGMLTEWMRQGTEGFYATQRILLDLVVSQNSHTVGTIRERLSEARSAPAAALTEIAGEGISNFIAAQRIMLQLVQRQNEIVMTGLKERATGAPMAAMTDIFRRGIETFIDMQQHFLSIASKQTDLWIDATKEGTVFDGKGAAELAREAMESFIRSQKKFLDVVADETAHASERHLNGKRQRKTDISELAWQGAEAFIDAQKKLLDVAAQQLTVNVKVGRETMHKLNPFPSFTFTDITRRTVDSFVTAQKALLEAMAKPSHSQVPPSGERAARKPKRPVAKHHKPVPVPA